MIYDIAVVGGGIVGLATALALLTEQHVASVIVLEAEKQVAAHQTGHNSGVIHAGLYYRPGSLKARLCAEGRTRLYAFCQEHGIPCENTGKLVVALTPAEVPRLEALYERGMANGLHLKRLAADELREYEPHVAGLAGLWVQETGIVDYGQVAEAYAHQVQMAGGRVRTNRRIRRVRRLPDRIVLETELEEIECRNLIACAGLQADRVAQRCGVEPGVRIVPFRGEYYTIRPERRDLVRGLVYPVPDPQFPFLGVHYTRRVDGSIEAGPNAVLALRREGYGKLSFRAADAWSTLSYGGFWRLAGRYWRTGGGEIYRSFSRYAFWRALQRLTPDLEVEDLVPGGAGVRAQALAPDGKLVDDFHIVSAYRQIHILNAPSPAATASLAIGSHVARLAGESFEGLGS